ncbi:MAG: hypothetical protein CME59_09215 [Halioglobus sp.]|nr:hypothetical protein [Halioglobus sp.]
MRMRNILGASLLLAFVPASLAPAQQQGLSKNYDSVDPNKPVVCLLPGRVRKVGGMMTYLERRKPVELAASECEIRGGEYTLYDRANYQTALKLWLEAAEQGDATAAVHVGEIYEKGWVGEPDYATAARWYRQAAAEGDTRAQRRLAYFYENGLGVEQDQEQALGLWRSALGLKEELVLASQVEAAKSQAQREIDRLVAQLDRQNQRTGQLQRSLDEARGTLHDQTTALETERAAVRRLQEELALSAQDGGDPGRLRELESQLAASESRIDEQRINIELLEADIAAQRAQVAASQRQAQVRSKQLERVQEDLIAESSRGDALLVQLQEKDASLRSLEQQLAAAQARLEQGRERQSELAARARAAQDDDARAQLEQELATARAEVDTQKARTAGLQREIAAQRDSFESQLADSRVRENELNSALAQSRTEKEALARQLEQASARLVAVDRELTRTRYALADREADAAGLREQLDTLAAQGGSEAQRRSLRERMEIQQREIAALREEKQQLIAGWEATQRERDEARANLAEEVDTTSWLRVELESAGGRLAATREELARVQLALEEANFARDRLVSDIGRLEQDLAASRERSVQDRQRMEDQLRRYREQLASSAPQTDSLRQQASRLQSDLDLYGQRQQGRVLAMRGLRKPVESITEIPRAARRANYHAIVIANYDYRYLPDLVSPPFDANQLKQMLEDAYGFNVEVLINLNRSDMYKALAMVREFDENDHVLLYYAGHGKMDEYGDGFWLPTDYHESQPLAETVSSADLTRTLNFSEAKHVIVMADSCYSGALARNADPVIRKSVPALMNYWIANKSRTVLTSGGLKPVLDDGPGGHSVFASALLQVLQSNAGALNGEMLHAQVYELVQQQAALLGYLDQRPRFAVIEDAGHENGQFVFLRGQASRG